MRKRWKISGNAPVGLRLLMHKTRDERERTAGPFSFSVREEAHIAPPYYSAAGGAKLGIAAPRNGLTLFVGADAHIGPSAPTP